MLITPLNFNHTPHPIKLDLSLILMSPQSPSPLVLTLGFWTWTRAWQLHLMFDKEQKQHFIWAIQEYKSDFKSLSL